MNLALDEAIEKAIIRDRGLSSREGIDLAVDRWLRRVTDGIVALGFRGGARGRVKPRRMSRMAWNRLQAAAERTGLHASILLRACCCLEAQADPNQREKDEHHQKEGESQ